MSRHRSPRSHEFIRLTAAMVAFTVFVVAVKVVQAGLLPWLLAGGVALVAWRAGRRTVRRRAVQAPQPPSKVVQGQVVDDDGRGLDRAELTRLRDENSALKAKCKVLSDMINGGPVMRP